MENDKRDIASRAETALTTASYFEKYGQVASGRRFVGDLLKFGKDGVYVTGQENREIARGTQMVAYMDSLRVGWLRWEDGRPVEGPMGLVANGFVPPKRDALEGTPDESEWERDDKGRPVNPWQIANDVALFNPQDETFYTFATSAKGGVGAIGMLSKAYGEHLRHSRRRRKSSPRLSSSCAAWPTCSAPIRPRPSVRASCACPARITPKTANKSRSWSKSAGRIYVTSSTTCATGSSSRRSRCCTGASRRRPATGGAPTIPS